MKYRDDFVPVDEAIDRALWDRPVELTWRVYHRSMTWLCRAMRGRLGDERGILADQRAWERELRGVSDR